jgi:peptide/nickel transport system ATP-binding protein
VLDVDRVVKRYGQRTALDGVSLTVRAGESVGIVGESGSGKSTLARIALGLLGCDGGTVTLNGRPWGGLPERRRRDRRDVIQLVSQDPLSSLNPRHTVRAAIAESLGARRLHTRRLDGEIGGVLSEVGLSPELLDRYPRQLSGGQRQRVAIARALARRPDLLVCDEPVSALDVRTQAQILRLLRAVSTERGMAIVLISHDLAVVRELCERVLVLKDGQVVEEGGIERIFRSPSHPYTAELLAAMPVLELAAGNSPATVEAAR